MALPKRKWQDMTSMEIAEADTSGWIAILPVCAIEQHGPHLPLGTDVMIGEGLLKAAMADMPPQLPVTALPTQAIGKSNEHISSPGTLTYHWQTVTNAWIEIGESLHRSGIRKLIILNSHGGNKAVIDVVAVELRVRYDMLVVSCSWMDFGVPEGVFCDAKKDDDIHGGDLETSLMCALHPDLVNLEMTEDFLSTQSLFKERLTYLRAHGSISFGWKAQDLNKKGVMGNAARANHDKGRALISHQATGFIALCHDVDQFDMEWLSKD